MLTIIRAPSQPLLEIDQKVSPYCPNNDFYLISSPDIAGAIKTIDVYKHERDKAIDRYENVLKGLLYWKARALERP